jgi:hypothetical protein
MSVILAVFIIIILLKKFFNFLAKSWGPPRYSSLHRIPTGCFAAQDNYVGFSSLKPVTKNDKELDYPKGRRVRDHAVVSTWEPRCFAVVALRGLRGVPKESGVPPT